MAVIVITLQPVSEIVAGGEEPSDMVIAATGNIEPLTYQWYQCDDAIGTNPVIIELGTTDTLTFGTMNPGGTTWYFCTVGAIDCDPTTLDSDIVSVYQLGLLPTPIPSYITGEFVLDYIGQCSTEVQTRFAAECARLGITFTDDDSVLYTAQLELFMQVI